MSWWDGFLRIRGGDRQRISRFDDEHEAIGEALKRLHNDCQLEVEGSDGGFYSYEMIRVDLGPARAASQADYGAIAD